MEIGQAKQMALDLAESKIRSFWFNAVETAANIHTEILGKSTVDYLDFILAVYQAYSISLETEIYQKEKEISA